MRFFVLALLALFAPASAIAQAPASVLTADSETRWVGFDLTPGNQIRFALTLDGRQASAVLDTGVSFTVASSAFARAVALKPAATGRAEAIGGTVAVGWAPVRSIAFGGLSRSGGRVAVADLTPIVTDSVKPVDLLVGADLLGAHALDIDYQGKRFRLMPSGRMPFRGVSVPLSLARDSGVYLGEIAIGGRRLRPLIVDTGDGAALTLSGEAWTAAGLSSLRLTSALAFGLGGEVITDLAVLQQIKIGTLTARNVEVRIERGAGFSRQTATAGRIGSALLGRYRVLMDPRAGRMVMAAGPNADQPPLRSTSGLLVALAPNQLRVMHVMRNSPAQAAGWRIGDRICRIDGITVPLDYIGNPIAVWTVGTPGRTVALGMCDGQQRALTLRAFY